MHAPAKSPWVYNLLQKGTSVSNWWNSAFRMDDSNELNVFFTHSVVDYKLIRNPPPPPLRSVLHFLSLVGFFPWSQSKSWIFFVSQVIINEQFPHCHDLSAIFLECTHCTNPPCLGSGMRGACWDSARYCSQLVATWLVGEQEAFEFEPEIPRMCTESARYFSPNDARFKWKCRQEREPILRPGARDLWGDVLTHLALWWLIPEDPLNWWLLLLSVNKVFW